MTRRAWMIVIGVVVVIAGVAVVLRRDGSGTVTVDVGEVTRRDVFRSYVTASGEIVATRFADIGSSVMGRIVDLTVAEGDRVAAGQVLARIDPVQARSDVAAAEAQIRALEAEQRAAAKSVDSTRSELALAQARAAEAAKALERTRELHAQGLAPTADLDVAQAAGDASAAQVAATEAAVARAEQALDAAGGRLAQARAQLARVEDVLSKTEIASPMDGVVSRLQVREGEMVVIGIQNQPGTTLMTISDLSEINAEVKVAEAEVLRVDVAQKASVTLDAMPGRTFAGRVVEVGASALPVTEAGAAAREFRVVVRLENPDPGLRPGLTCDAEILTSERRDAFTVPLQAVVLRPTADAGAEQSGVFVVEDGRTRFQPVETGIIGGLDIEVTGIDAGTPIVVGPFQTLREMESGASVRVNNAGDGP